MRRAVVVLILTMAGACGGEGAPSPGTRPTPVIPTTAAAVVTTTVAITTTVPMTTTTTAETTTTTPETWALAIVGDFGDGGDAESEVARAMSRWAADHPELRALVTTGDNFYVADVVAAWFTPYQWVVETGLPVWAAPGNHDIETAELREASVVAFGEFPGWRTREVGAVTLVLLDSNQAGSDEQQAWLEQTVGALGDRPWIAAFHHLLRSCGVHDSSADVSARWGDLLEGALLVLNGHDHNYQRFQTKSGWSVVTGGGGRALHAIGECEPGVAPPLVAVEAFHFVSIVGDAAGIDVAAIAVDGSVLDSFRLDYRG